MSFLIGVVALSTTILSAYALSQSLASISNVKIYEKKAEKAADWSNSAKKRLWDTRYTIGTGLISSLISLLSGIAYSFFVPGRNDIFVASWRWIWPAFLAVSLFAAARYMQNFWATKAKVPLLEQYNAAIKQSTDVFTFLNLVGALWGLLGCMKLLGL